MSAKQRENLSGHLLATCQWDQVGMGANQLLSWRPITGPKGKLGCFSNPEILGGGGRFGAFLNSARRLGPIFDSVCGLQNSKQPFPRQM